MAWLRSNAEMAHHPKVEDLADRLDISIAQAVGHLHMLWWWAMEYAPDGDLSAFSNRKIARAAGWEGSDPDVFVNALVECGTRNGGFLDQKNGGGYTLHNWDERMGVQFRERKYKAEKSRRHRERSKNSREDSSVTGNVTGGQDGQDKTDRTGRNRTERTDGPGGSPASAPAPVSPLLHSPTPASAVAAAPQPASASGRDFPCLPDTHDIPDKPIFTQDPALGPVPGIAFDNTAYLMLTLMYALVPEYEADPLPEQRLVQDLGQEYPNVDLQAEFKKAEAWLRDNPGKVNKNLRQFLRNWVRREAERQKQAEMPMFVPAPPEPVSIAR